MFKSVLEPDASGTLKDKVVPLSLASGLFVWLDFGES